MLKNILNLEVAQQLTKKNLQTIKGGNLSNYDLPRPQGPYEAEESDDSAEDLY